jgi:hypothetical protein
MRHNGSTEPASLSVSDNPAKKLRTGLNLSAAACVRGISVIVNDDRDGAEVRHEMIYHHAEKSHAQIGQMSWQHSFSSAR